MGRLTPILQRRLIMTQPGSLHCRAMQMDVRRAALLYIVTHLWLWRLLVPRMEIHS